MQNASSGFAALRDFTQVSSSDERRDLLRRVTDSFAGAARANSPADCAVLDEVVSAVTADLTMQLRAELAGKIALTNLPFPRTARALAMDDIAVAQPVLAHSRALSETDLLDVIAQKSQDHMLVVSRRTDVSENISGALVAHGEDRVVAALLENPAALIADKTYEAAAERAKDSEVLHAPFVRRQGVPLDLLSDLYMRVEGRLRREILRKYESVSPVDVEAAFARSRVRLAKAYGGLPTDYAESRKRVEQMRNKLDLTPQWLVALMREGEKSRTTFFIAFAALTDVNYELISNTVGRGDLDTLAILCRAGGFDRALFVTLANMIAGGEHRMANVEKFGALYESVPPIAAERALRFWKVRRAA